jgi:hypothetical protein
MAEVMRFSTGLSRRLRARSALELMLTLNINLAGRAHFPHDVVKGPPRFSFALTGGPAYIQVFDHIFVIFDGKNDGSSVPARVGHVLNSLFDGYPFTDSIMAGNGDSTV